MKYKLTAITLAAAALSVSACRSTLYSAARDGDLQTVKEELAEGADPEGKASGANLIWQVPTYLLALPIDIVRLLGPITLIEPFIDPGWEFSGEVDKNGNRKLRFNDDTLLTKKVYQFGDKTAMSVTKNPEIITELLLAGAAGSDFQKAKATSEAARKGDAATLQKLLQKGIKANWYCSGDYSPLMLAIGGGHEECARVLLANGATFSDTVTVGGQQITCYDYAISKGQFELLKKLGGAEPSSPASMAGKQIVFDFSKAQYRSNEKGPLKRSKWGKYPSDYRVAVSSPHFDNNNTFKFDYKETQKYESLYQGQEVIWDADWTYEKTGAKTATIGAGDGGGWSTYSLIFETPYSGTASEDSLGEDGGYHGEGSHSEAKGIRFKIK